MIYFFKDNVRAQYWSSYFLSVSLYLLLCDYHLSHIFLDWKTKMIKKSRLSVVYGNVCSGEKIPLEYTVRFTTKK